MLSMDSKAGSSVEYFSLITFSDVPESYSTLTDVVCCFTRALNMSPESADYVGIFPVGWQSVDEYVCSKPVIISADPESTHSVTFPADSLPRDSDEFYHFCYVSASDRRVRGVSTPFQFASERQNDWEIVEPLLSGETMNGESAEHEAVQQQQQQMPNVVDESSQVLSSVTEDGSQEEVGILRQQLLSRQQELEKQAAEYGSSMDAMQLSLDEIRRQCIEKDAKLDQLRTTLEQYEKQEEKHKSEVETLKSAHASSLASQAAERQVQMLQLDNDRVNIEQLKTALDSYQQREAEWKQRENDLLNELQKMIDKGESAGHIPPSAVPAQQQEEPEDAAESPAAAAADEQQTDVKTADHVEETADEQFEDASDVIEDRTCPICNLTFSACESEELFISHVEDHVVKICPVCTREFPPDDEDYIRHVNICVASNEQQEQQQQQQQPLYPPLRMPEGQEFV